MSPLSPVDPEPALVTMHFWGVRTRHVPDAVVRMALDRRTLRETRGLRFAKLLGTGSGRTFTLKDADPRHWGLLATWESSAAALAFEGSMVTRAWARISDEHLRIAMTPIASRGRWAGRAPFGTPTPRAHDGPVAAITRARINPRKALNFWRAVPPVSRDLHRSAGLLFAIGIGEAPIGLQATFSIWESAAALTQFAFRRSPHLDAIRRTSEEAWYSEELFARFAVVEQQGRLGSQGMPGHPA